jgi:CMP-N-acetylneuraminic acid synthetase
LSANSAARVVSFIFARGGSKGLPGKNVKPLNGKPLIAYSIEAAKECRQIETVIVSTDDQEIAAVARDYGAETPFVRPAELATDDAPEWLAWKHAISWFEQNRGPFDVFVSLPATSPFRARCDIEDCIVTLLSDKNADIVVTGCKAARSPYFNMVKVDPSGYVSVAVDGSRFAHRQEAPQLYDLTTVAYVARPKFVLTAARYFDGHVRLVEVPSERALDIDTQLEFDVAEFLVKRNQSQ